MKMSFPLVGVIPTLVLALSRISSESILKKILDKPE
jgi:hypothetical protein